MPLQATSGAASYDAFGGGVAAKPVYIEDVFSTWLYTGDGGFPAIQNGVDLATKGGMVWIKSRQQTTNHILVDSDRGVPYVSSNTTQPENGSTTTISSFNSDGFSVTDSALVNGSGFLYVSWAFAGQPKFFDVLTYTGDGTVSRNISHNLGSDPGSIFLKRTSGAVSSWAVYHRSTGTGKYLQLNTTGGVLTDASTFASVTSTTFSVSSNTNQNDNGESYVAYLFAHDAGGFGLTGTDNVISCGSVAVTGSAQSVSVGYEPQWILWKKSSSSGSWWMFDTMRGLVVDNGSGTGDKALYAELSNAETGTYGIDPTATGFDLAAGWGAGDYIYIAIRKGPMKVPTTGTSVLNISQWPGTFGAGKQYTGFPVDSLWANSLSGYTWNTEVFDRLRKISTVATNVTGGLLSTSQTTAESTNAGTQSWYSDRYTQSRGSGYIYYALRRAPSFFDEVCYTGDGTADSRTFTHNLGVTPQLVIVKRRSSTSDWVVMFNTDHAVLLNSTNADTGYSTATGNYANGILIGTNSTTLTQYSGASGNSACNASGSTYVAYLFATAAGVSKVGSYTGNGSTQTINCGFTGGARFVLIKRTDSTGDWYAYDTARGMTTLTDPYLLLNSTAAETATLGSVTTVSTGFALNSTILAAINISGGSYIFFAVA